MKYKLRRLVIRIRYYYRIIEIKLTLRSNLFRLFIAVRLFRAVNKLSPEFVQHYAREVIRSYERTGSIGLRF